MFDSQQMKDKKKCKKQIATDKNRHEQAQTDRDR